MKPIVITPATTNIVTLAEVKSHLRITQTDDDTMLQGLITLAEEMIESVTRTTLLNSSLKMVLDKFPKCNGDLFVDYGPVTSISSIEYYDSNNTKVSLDLTDVYQDLNRVNARLKPVNAWPNTYARPNAVEITFSSGYETVEKVPMPIKQAALLMVGHYYENREWVTQGSEAKEVPFTVAALLSPYKMVRV